MEEIMQKVLDAAQGNYEKSNYIERRMDKTDMNQSSFERHYKTEMDYLYINTYIHK